MIYNSGHPSLLQHDFREPDTIRIAIPSPGQIAFVPVKPFQQTMLKTPPRRLRSVLFKGHLCSHTTFAHSNTTNYGTIPEAPHVAILLQTASTAGSRRWRLFHHAREYDTGCLPVDLPCPAGNNG